ncbi:hypothetical protein MWU58_00945 [Flavobacteriaceae bacterium S0825]|uniref:hypothetical protein n=1 Tax=Gaetbulibacter sp. S0825 TaxID=2720084 RepID=UPI00142F932F|nr:hypothetical protein [Gaetbulibacter sp. S0825]MCK0107847.1 hypothetical protein [Flavobacteriaceae bacterium S0825]NIX63483.1 hypothetical protein [Gaetbulibacter sp. S0825]
MKPLKITLLIAAVFCLTISGTSEDTKTELDFSKSQVQNYKELKKDSKFIASVGKKKGNKPGQEVL